MFLAYIIVNLIDPLAQGLQVYKVIYKPQTFHYVTARLAGLAAVVHFVLYWVRAVFVFVHFIPLQIHVTL